VPLILVGGWTRRRSDDFLPWLLYAAALLLGATFLFPLHVPGGAFVHSAVGLGPHAYILALEAVAVLIGWIARRRPAWDPRVAVPLFSAFVVAFVVLSAVGYGGIVHARWAEARAPRQALASAADALGMARDDRVMSTDAAGFKYWTGRPGVVSPDDPIETIQAVAKGYGIRWLVLERDAIVRALQPVLVDDVRPAWIGPAVFSYPDPAGGPAALALYPVCLTASDARCGGGS